MADLDIDTYDRLVGLIYEAGHDPSRWQAALDAIDAFADGAYIGLHGYDPTLHPEPTDLFTRFSPEAVDAFMRYYGSVNPYARAALAMPERGFVEADRVVPRGDLRRTEFYADFFRPNEDLGPGFGGVIARDGGRLCLLTGNVPFRMEDRVQPRLIEALTRLAPHFRRAFDMQRRLAGSRILAEGGAATSGAAFVLDVEGQVLDATPAAHAMASEGERVARRADGRLRFPGRRAQRWLEMTLRRFTCGEIGAGPDVRPLAGGTQGAAFLEPVPGRTDGAARIVAALDSRRPVAVLMLRPALVDPGRAVRVLRRLYGLTEAEAGVAYALARGAAPDEVAAAKGVSVHTVRAQIRSVFLAMGCTKQGQVAALVRDVVG